MEPLFDSGPSSVLQALSVQWTERSLQELRRCRPGRQEHQEQLQQEQEQERLQQQVRQLQRWLEDTYRHQLQLLQQKLSAQKEDLLQVRLCSDITR